MKISGRSFRPGGDRVYVTLWRDIPFWLDKSYGTKSYALDSRGSITWTQSWNVDMRYYYYLHITKITNDSYWATGQYTISN